MRASVLVLALIAALCLCGASAYRNRNSRTPEVHVARHEFFRFASSSLNYHADSAGCTPLSNYVNWPLDKSSSWPEWEKRLPELADKTKGMSAGEKAATVLESMGSDNIWHQIIDGWSHLEGPLAFEAHYVTDMKRGFKECAKLLRSGVNSTSFHTDFYTRVHDIAFEKSAKKLDKRNGLRGSNSWIYLPMPDKPLGVFKDVHLNGKKTYTTGLRKIDKNGDMTPGWKFNKQYQMRWVYPNISIKQCKGNISAIFDWFWQQMAKVSGSDEVEARKQKLKAVVWLYHSLENLHPFVDGNGRTDILVLDTMLSFIGLHPVAFYNSMESALSSPDEMVEKVLEGYFMWEKTLLNVEKKVKPPSAWTLDAIKEKNKECRQAIDALIGNGTADASTFIPDTEGGCMCKSVEECDKNAPFKGSKWCYTTTDCTWKWDYCAGGRRKTPQTPKEPELVAYALPWPKDSPSKKGF